MSSLSIMVDIFKMDALKFETKERIINKMAESIYREHAGHIDSHAIAEELILALKELEAGE